MVEWLRKERSFQIDLGIDEVRMAQTMRAPEPVGRVETDVCVFFMSRATLADRAIMKALRTLLAVPWRVLLVCLEALNPDAILESLMHLFPATENTRQAYKSILDRISWIEILASRLEGDRVNWNEADDLMVRIFYQANPARLSTACRMNREETEFLRGATHARQD